MHESNLSNNPANTSCATNTACCHTKCLSWSAIILGALIAIGLGFLLNLFCVALGLSVFSNDSSTTFAVSGFVGLVVAAFVSMFVGGFVAGHLGRACCPKRNMGEIYGFASWCVALLLTMMLASHMSEFVSHSNYAVNPNATTVHTTTNTNAPLMTERKHGSAATQVTVNTEKAANSLGQAAFITFFLFFIGAIGSCFGGRCGMCMRCPNKNGMPGSC